MISSLPSHNGMTCAQAHDPVWRMGEMLWSAVKHGCLLDPRWWSAWVTGIEEALCVNSSLLSVDMCDDRRWHRWFADPVTKLLIVHWRQDRLRLPDGATPQQCLQHYGTGFSNPNDCIGTRLIDEVKRYRQFSMPGLLIGYAAGQTASFSAPYGTWSRIIYGMSPSDRDPLKEIVEQRTEPDIEKTLYREMAPERKALRPTASYKRGLHRARHYKRAAILRLASLPSAHAPIPAMLRKWSLFALRNGQGRSGRGFAVSTVTSYLRALVRLFADWSINTPLEATTDELERYVRSTLHDVESASRDKLIKAFRSFERFRCHWHGSRIPKLDLDEFEVADRASPDLVLPGEYQGVLRALDRAGEVDVALLTILLFRTGLRIDEAIALRAGDFCDSNGHFELVIETHDHHLLKTRTSRRIIPLDILLEGNELLRVRKRVQERLVACQHGVEAWIFGPPLAVSPPAYWPAKEKIERELFSVGRRPRLRHQHLRHSFASYLLATLMLPQDVSEPAIPDRLKTVISPARFERVADRLLGSGRLGGASLHAVSQIMGHTGPVTTLHYYVHLLDFSLGLYTSRPSSFISVDNSWLTEMLNVGPDALRKAKARKRQEAPIRSTKKARHRRPTASEIRFHTPEIHCKAADVHLLEAGAKRLARPLVRELEVTALDLAKNEEIDRPKTAAKKPAPQRRTPPSYSVPWRSIMEVLKDPNLPAATDTDRQLYERWHKAGAAFWKNLAAQNAGTKASPQVSLPHGREFAQFVDLHLNLPRSLRRDEQRAVEEVVLRWARGKRDIRLSRLKDAEAFVGLLIIMGFKPQEVVLSLTSRRAQAMSSNDIHRFLSNREEAPHLAGRSGWRGSLMVQLRPEGLAEPILARRACRFALVMLMIDINRN